MVTGKSTRSSLTVVIDAACLDDSPQTCDQNTSGRTHPNLLSQKGSDGVSGSSMDCEASAHGEVGKRSPVSCEETGGREVVHPGRADRACSEMVRETCGFCQRTDTVIPVAHNISAGDNRDGGDHGNVVRETNEGQKPRYHRPNSRHDQSLAITERCENWTCPEKEPVRSTESDWDGKCKGGDSWISHTDHCARTYGSHSFTDKVSTGTQHCQSDFSDRVSVAEPNSFKHQENLDSNRQPGHDCQEINQISSGWMPPGKGPISMVRGDDSVFRLDHKSANEGHKSKSERSNSRLKEFEECDDNSKDQRSFNSRDSDVKENEAVGSDHSPMKKARISDDTDRAKLENCTDGTTSQDCEDRAKLENNAHRSMIGSYDDRLSNSLDGVSLESSKESMCYKDTSTGEEESHNDNLNSITDIGTNSNSLMFDDKRSDQDAVSQNESVLLSTKHNRTHRSVSSERNHNFSLQHPHHTHTTALNNPQDLQTTPRYGELPCSFPISSATETSFPNEEPKPELFPQLNTFSQQPITLGTGAFRAPGFRRNAPPQIPTEPRCFGMPPYPINFLRSQYLHTLHHHHHNQHSQHNFQRDSILSSSGLSNSRDGNIATAHKPPIFDHIGNQTPYSGSHRFPGEASDRVYDSLGRCDVSFQPQHLCVPPAPTSVSTGHDEMLNNDNDLSGEESGSDDLGNITSNMDDAMSPSPSSHGNKTKGCGGDDMGGGTSKDSRSRRRRTAFTSEQLLELEKEFHSKKYLSLTERSGIAAHLRLSEVQVRN